MWPTFPKVYDLSSSSIYVQFNPQHSTLYDRWWINGFEWMSVGERSTKYLMFFKADLKGKFIITVMLWWISKTPCWKHKVTCSQETTTSAGSIPDGQMLDREPPPFGMGFTKCPMFSACQKCSLCSLDCILIKQIFMLVRWKPILSKVNLSKISISYKNSNLVFVK